MPIEKIRVRLKERSYDILIGRNIIDHCGCILRSLDIGADAVVITNLRVSAIYRKRLERTLKQNGITSRFELIPDSEKAKSLQSAGNILNKLSRYDVNKRIFIIALGGGVVGDLAGFVASVYKRGIPYVQIPTTLLAQIDSSIGGKVAVDLKVGKNLVGSFYQPKAVIIDIASLKTLSVKQIRNGLAEVIKYGIIKDPALFAYIERNHKRILKLDLKAIEHIVLMSVRIKSDIVVKDEFDRKGIRAILNYGHTIGHAIEAAAGYSSRYNHGEAIALGMLAASEIAAGLKLINETAALRIKNVIANVGLPVSVKGLSSSSIYAAHLHDKKFIKSRNRFILASDLGRVSLVDGVRDSIVRNALTKLYHR